MTIGRICSRQVDLAELNESTRIAAQRMLQRQVGSLIVVDALGVPVGILTDRDLVTKVMARGISPDDATVAEAMTAHPHYVHEDASIEDGLRMMRAGRHRRLPVVDGDGRLLGINFDVAIGQVRCQVWRVSAKGLRRSCRWRAHVEAELVANKTTGLQPMPAPIAALTGTFVGHGDPLTTTHVADDWRFDVRFGVHNRVEVVGGSARLRLRVDLPFR